MTFIHSTSFIFDGLANETPISMLFMDDIIVLMIWQDP
jgi:hypothetical protein